MTAIRTSDDDWHAAIVRVYRSQGHAFFYDDAKIGIDPANDTLFVMGQKAGLSVVEWAAVPVALGLGGLGFWLVRAAILDPEPTTKLSLLVLGGVVCIYTGAHRAIEILTDRKPPNVKTTPGGMEIRW